MRKFKDLFKSKKRIEAERLAHEQEMKNREFNAKVTINKTLNKMKSQTKKLDEIKNGYYLTENANINLYVSDKKIL